MILHPWWYGAGEEISSPEELVPALAKDLTSLAAERALPGVTLVGYRQSTKDRYATLALDIETERPQDIAHSIKAVEPIAIVLPFNQGQPTILSLRADFPDTQHQNWSPDGEPCCLCIDDRPWAEARMTATAQDIVRRIQLWLAKAARGELHDQSQPLDPLFYKTAYGIILPAEALRVSGVEPIELIGRIRPDNPNLIISRVADSAGVQGPALCVLTFHAQPQAMARLRHAPATLSSLASELLKCGINLIDELTGRLRNWSKPQSALAQRLTSRLAIVVAFQVVGGAGRTVSDFRAFITYDTAGEIGVALGILLVNQKVGNIQPYVQVIGKALEVDRPLRVEPAEIYFSLNRELAAMFAGRTRANGKRAVMVGCGSIGSQFAINLAREGIFAWTVVDNDYLLPHNLVRHALFENEVGAPKAAALARHLSGLLSEPVSAIQANVLDPDPDQAPRLTAVFVEAEVIIDASASVAASRFLSDLEVAARRVSIYFNPAGTSAILLVESADRSITLRDLEAQYYRSLLIDPGLIHHLAGGDSSRYSGSCRTLTNRIPASNAAILSGLASKGAAVALDGVMASITVWTLSSDGEVTRIELPGRSVTHFQMGDWTVSYDSGLTDRLLSMRQEHLPNETGGVMLGIADMSNKSIHIAHAMQPPTDSVGTPSEFERGIANVAKQVEAATAATMNQLRYVGEWHSHPDHASVIPSGTDIKQLFWLQHELKNEGLPGLVAVVGQEGHFSISYYGSKQAGSG